MFRERKRFVAIVMIALLAAAMAVMFIVNRSRSDEITEEYKEAEIRLKQHQLERDAAYEKRTAKEKAAAENVTNAATVHLPGVAFYGRRINETDVGGELPLIVETLIGHDLLNTVVSVVDLNDPHETALQRAYLPVIFIESDSGLAGDTEAMLAEQKKLIAGRERYIVLGVPSGTRDEMKPLEDAMAAEYGDSFINLREYLSTDGMASLGLTIAPEDEAAMDEGRVPPGLLQDDGITLNETGYKLAAFLTYSRMDDLGYFDEIEDALDKYDEETAIDAD